MSGPGYGWAGAGMGGGAGAIGWCEDGRFRLREQLRLGAVTALHASSRGPVCMAWSDLASHGRGSEVGWYDGDHFELLYRVVRPTWVRAIVEAGQGDV